MADNRSGEVIWRRTIDESGDARRRLRFLRWYCAPVAIVAGIVAVLVDLWSAVGVLIVFGLVGLLIGGWVFLQGRNLRMNPELLRDGDVLHVGSKVEVPISQVVRWTTYPREMSMSTEDVSNGGITVHVAEFRLEVAQPDGSVRPDAREFFWSLLPEHDQASLGAALESVIPGRWMPLDAFRQIRS